MGANPRDELVDDLAQMATAIQGRIAENNTILEQSRLEVQSLQRRWGNVSTQLTRVEEHFDSVPRDDIKNAYEDVIEVRTRLTAMQGQLEKLQETQNRLSEFKATVEDISSRMGGVSLDGFDGGGGAVDHTLSLAGEQIIRIVEAQESERQRLANALHDGPAQSLTNFILQAEICQRLFNRDQERANVELNNLKSAASVSFQKIREFIFDLRPMMLDDLGLVATVKRQIESIDESEEISAEFHMTGKDRRLPKHIEVIMFRSIQLLVNNARDILDAKNISVLIDMGDKEIRGTVENDGRGFDPDIVLDRDQGDSPLNNLIDMKERVDLIGGQTSIYSAENEGTKVDVILYFSQED